MTQFAAEIRRRLGEAIQPLPPGFYSSFDYVETGSNRCHAVTIGLLARIVADLPGIAFVGIDVPVKEGDAKMKPDVVGFDVHLHERIFVDFESPNSSDTRVKEKDIDPYLAWRAAAEDPVPYVIITSLPNCHSPEWQLRWASGDQYNTWIRKNGPEIRQALFANPLRFWRQHWRDMTEDTDLPGITLLNIDRKAVRRVRL